MSKEGVSVNTESVLRENETKANRMLTLILNVTILVVVRMVRALNINSKDTAKELLGNMRHAVDGFVQNAPQFDDLTMLCLEYNGLVEK